jgi:hypothetical protein
MKTYACDNCGRGLESGEFALPRGRRSLYGRCPSCGSTVSVSGVAFIVAGVLLALLVLTIPTDESEFTGIVGGGALMAFGITRLEY